MEIGEKKVIPFEDWRELDRLISSPSKETYRIKSVDGGREIERLQ